MVITRVNTVRASGVLDFDREGRYDMSGVDEVRRSERNKERLNYKDRKGVKKNREQEQNREEDEDMEADIEDTEQLGATGGGATGGEQEQNENPLDLTDYNLGEDEEDKHLEGESRKLDRK